MVPTYYAKIQVVLEGRIELLLVGGGGITRGLLILSQNTPSPVMYLEFLMSFFEGGLWGAEYLPFSIPCLPCRVRSLSGPKLGASLPMAPL